jgi:hypothetical protein
VIYPETVIYHETVIPHETAETGNNTQNDVTALQAQPWTLSTAAECKCLMDEMFMADGGTKETMFAECRPVMMDRPAGDRYLLEMKRADLGRTTGHSIGGSIRVLFRTRASLVKAWVKTESIQDKV